MEFRVLGHLEVWRDGQPLSLGSSKQRSLLALLLIHAGRVLSTDEVIDELWGEDGAADRHNALWIQVSKLRSTLEPDRAPRSDGGVLGTRPPGYVLLVEPDQIDASRFELLVQEARQCAATDPGLASVLLSQALALWRGRPYEDFLYESFAQPEIARLDELRLEAVELRLDADLRCGRARELVGELQGMVRQHPLREGFSAQLMLALYRSGRQADALRAYGELRRRLSEELGLDPSPALRQLEGQILRGDAELDVRARPATPSPRVAVRGYELREQIGRTPLGATYRAYQPAVGREVALTVVGPELADDADFIRRFLVDADVAAALRHPNIVAVDDVWREPGAAYVVTRLVDARALADVLDDGALPPEMMVTVVDDVASALAVAHQRGFVHGAIGPSTVVVEDGRGLVNGVDLVPSGAAVGWTSARRDDRFDAPEQVNGGRITPSTDVYRLGRLLEALLDAPLDHGDDAHVGRHLGPRPAGLERLITAATADDAGARPPDAAAFVTALRDAVAEPRSAAIDSADAASPMNPYKGLQAFGEADAADFFGRERVVERLLARLGAGGTAGRFVAVVGPSGSGKSSAVRAGLLPALRADALPGASQWFVVDIIPGAHPFEELAAGLASIAVHPPADLLERLVEGPSSFRRALNDSLPDDQSQLVLVIDQFEEIFALAGADTAKRLLDALADTVVDRHSRVRVVITLRADFYDRPLSHYAFGELLRRGTELIAAMSPEELQRAIVEPAQRLDVRFEPGLVAQVVTDVAEQPAALPLMQFALTELFEQRSGTIITLAAYRALGGAAGALAHRAEGLYALLTPEARETTRQVMLRLVTVGGSDDEVTRRRVLRQELDGLGEARVGPVLDTLAAHRLLAFDRDAMTRAPTVEIAHEALFREWSRLRTWIDEARDDVRRHHRLAEAAEEWHRSSEAPDYLLSGGRLDEVVAFADRDEIALTGFERSFLDASVSRRDAERAAEQHRREREARLRRKARRRTALLAGSALVIAAVGTVAVTQVARSRASDRTESARSLAERLALASTGVAAKEPDLAMLLALQSLTTSAEADLPASAAAEDALHWAIQAAGVTYPVEDAPMAVRTGPNGPTGVFRMPLPDLVRLARGELNRGFTEGECAQYSLDPCPPWAQGLASPLGAGPAPVPSPPPERPTATDQLHRLSGTTVTVLDAPSSGSGLDADLRRFTEQTGVQVNLVHTSTWDFDRLPDGGRPDVTLAFSPSLLRRLATHGRLVDLSTYIDPDTFRARVGDRLADQATVARGVYWVPLTFSPKDLVWYSVPAFRRAGYEVPQTIGELIALGQRMVRDGATPWCLGTDSFGYSGWTVTDWLESIVLRVAGADVYDRWISHEIPFDDPAIRRSGDVLNQVLFQPGFVLGGPARASRFEWSKAVQPLYEDPPRCLMTGGGEGVTNTMPGNVRLGEDIDYFSLPPVTAGSGPLVEAGGLAAAAMSDRPEVRTLMRYLASRNWGDVASHQPYQWLIPASPGLSAGSCVDPADDLTANTVRVRLCQDARAALASGHWRPDASDNMPAAIGGINQTYDDGAFLTGMVQYVAQGPDSLDGILAGIERSWSEAEP